MSDKTGAGSWLHDRLARSAKHIIGIDYDSEGVAAARKLGYEAYQCDCEDAAAVQSLAIAPSDVAVAGELIEHLDQPGAFLEAVKPLLHPGGALVLTTPNAVSLTNFLVALARREWVNPDHVAMYSWRTLTAMLARHDWEVDEVLFYYRGRRAGPEARSHPWAAAIFNVYERMSRPLFRIWPTLADGLIVVARRSSPGSAPS
jgi:SAM-dependent methyltransferase